MRAVRAAGREWPSEIPLEDLREPGVQLSEWERDGWTYHAKGTCTHYVSSVSCSDLDRHCRHMAPSNPFITSMPHIIRLNKFELALRQHRHGTLLHARHHITQLARAIS